jgi:hypothetical protein
MANLSLSIDGLDRLASMQRFLDPKLYDKASKSAIRYASKAVPPAVAKGITSSYGIKSARVKQDISRVRIEQGGQAAVIGFSRRPPTLMQYGAKAGTRGTGRRGLGRGRGWSPPAKPGRPLTAMTLKAKGRQKVPGAFIARGNNGNQLVLQRQGDKLKALYGPSVGSIFLGRSEVGEQLRSDVEQRVSQQFVTGFERALKADARGFGGK